MGDSRQEIGASRQEIGDSRQEIGASRQEIVARSQGTPSSGETTFSLKLRALLTLYNRKRIPLIR